VSGTGDRREVERLLQRVGDEAVVQREVARLMQRDADALDRVWRAMMLARSLEVCEALLRGESVPLEQLDPEWVARFGRRES
jgi:hypothetical protein